MFQSMSLCSKSIILNLCILFHPILISQLLIRHYLVVQKLLLYLQLIFIFSAIITWLNSANLFQLLKHLLNFSFHSKNMCSTQNISILLQVYYINFSARLYKTMLFAQFPIRTICYVCCILHILLTFLKEKWVSNESVFQLTRKYNISTYMMKAFSRHWLW